MKIVFLDEKPSEIKLYENILEKARIPFEGRVAKTENEFIKQVNHFNPDIILSVNAPVKFNDNEALKYLKEQMLQIPFIIISNKISEKMATGYLKEGADDYVTKKTLSHLPVVIKNAIAKKTAEKDKFNADILRKISEEKLRNIFVNNPECIFHIGFKGELLEMNPAAFALTGLKPDLKLNKIKIWDFVSKPHLRTLKTYHQGIFRGHKREFTFRFVSSKKINYSIETVGIPMRDADKNVIAAIFIGRNITEKEKAVKEMQVARSNFNALIENINQNAWSVDKEYRLVSFNKFYSKSYKENLGKYPRAGKLFYEDIRKDILNDFIEKWKTYYDRALAGEQFSFVDNSLVKKEETYYQISLYPILVNGEVTGVSCISADITEIKKNKIALRKSEEKFRLLSENSPVGIYLSDENGNCNYVNKKWCEMTGLSPEEASGKGWVNAIHPEDRERLVERWNDTSEKKLLFHEEYRYLSRIGEIVWVVGNAVANKDANGKITGYIGAVEDVTQIKTKEMESVETQKNFYDIFDNSPDAIYIEDEKGNILNANLEASKFQGMTREELIGKNITDLAPPEKSGEIMENFNKLFKEEISRLKSNSWNKNGSVIPIEINSRRITFNGIPAILMQVRELLKS